VASGDLGELRLVRAHLECFRAPDYYRESDWRGRWAREGGSVLINQAYHMVDLLRLLAGPVKALSANMATFAGPEVMETEDTLVASFVYQSGALGSLTLSGSAGSIWSSYIELLGAGGFIAFDINYPNVIHRLQLNSKRAMQQWKKRFAEPLPEEFSAPPAGIGYYGTSHRLQARAFVEEIRKGGPPALGGLEEAMEVVGLIQRIYSSARAR
jgi:predicted dehydrogenase